MEGMEQCLHPSHIPPTGRMQGTGGRMQGTGEQLRTGTGEQLIMQGTGEQLTETGEQLPFHPSQSEQLSFQPSQSMEMV